MKPPSRFRRTAPVALALAALLTGCGQRSAPPETRAPMALAVRVLSDTGATRTLDVSPPHDVAIWMARVSPTPPAAPDLGAPLPMEDAALPDEPPAPPALEVDPGLKPPILRTPAALRPPAARRGRGASVEMDVRVDEQGNVSDALWAGGSDDSLLVAAATQSALGMRFHPALRSGRPVAVWCRQRFDFGRR